MRKAGVLILVLLLTSLGLVILDQAIGLGIVKGALTWVLTPLQDGFQDGGEQTSDFWDRWREAGRLQQENDELRELVEYLTAENRRYQEIKRENDELRQLLGLQERYPELHLLPAEVIGRDPGSVRQVLRVEWLPLIDESIKVQEGMVVISSAGLVGRIIQVYPSAADVLLITDADSAVSAVVQNEDRPTGIVNGGWQAGFRLRMRFIPQGDAANVDDWVVSSGLQLPPFEEEAFPSGIPIGQILEVKESPDMHQQAEILPAVDFNHLERVMIVVGTR
jgi:rod shape-determining protein MreC